jgi:hypothetical protein
LIEVEQLSMLLHKGIRRELGLDVIPLADTRIIHQCPYIMNEKWEPMEKVFVERKLGTYRSDQNALYHFYPAWQRKYTAHIDSHDSHHS